MPAAPFISIVMPTLNEAAHLDRALDAIAAQTHDAERIEILVVDGGSSDGTVDIVADRMARDPRVQLIRGSEVNTPLAMELGRERARGELIAKIDGHGWINPEFLEIAVSRLEQDPSIGCVGGLIRPVHGTEVERAISIARFSRAGVGGGTYTRGGRAEEVDTVQCGVYRRDALEDAGGFDPLLPYGEDEEVNFRLREQGWRIWFEPAMEFAYRVRPSLAGLFRQYFRYGRARVAVVRKHPSFFRVKHAVPATVVIVLGVGASVAVVPGGRVIGLAPALAYLATLAVTSLYLAARHRFHRPDLLAGGLLAVHAGYGLGTLAGLVDLAGRAIRRSGSRSGSRT